jgi:hypothetical protein
LVKMNETGEIERYILFSTGLVLGMILSYTGLLGFLAGIGTGVFVGNRYDKVTKLVVETAKKMVVDKSK